MSNPLLTPSLNGLPVFSSVMPEHVEEAIEKILIQNRAQLKAE